jgi:hypothetical protein
MGSYSQSVAKDQRFAIEGDTGQLAGTGSQIANPLGVNIRGQSSANHLTYGDITVNEFSEGVSSLVKDILASNEKLLTTSLDHSSAVTEKLSSVVEGEKTPLSQYLPFIVLGIAAVYLLKKR